MVAGMDAADCLELPDGGELVVKDACLIIAEGHDSNKRSLTCCSFTPSGPFHVEIPWLNILWAEAKDAQLDLVFARQKSNSILDIFTKTWSNVPSKDQDIQAFASRLMNLAYATAPRQRRLCVLINPSSGTSRAQKIYERQVKPILEAARCIVTVHTTTARGNAVDIARNLCIDDFDVIACCSGDGLPHEVFNGFAQRQDARRALSQIAVAQIPCGTGNALSWNLYGTDHPGLATLYTIKGVCSPLDLASITQGSQRTLSFLSQSLGIVAEADLATEHLRWLGDARFTYGIMSRILGKTIWPCDLAVDVEIASKDKIGQHWHTYSQGLSQEPIPASGAESQLAKAEEEGSLPPLQFGKVQDPLPDKFKTVPGDQMGNFFCGKMALVAAKTPLLPAALPNDGYLDLVDVRGDVPRVEAMKLMLAVEKNQYFNQPHVNYRKIRGYRITPKNQKDGYISIDGERFPFAPFQAEVHPGLGTVIARRLRQYEVAGPPEPTFSPAQIQ